MAIEKNNFKVSRFDSEISPGIRESMSSEEDEFQRPSSAVESDEDEFDDADSGAGSDDFDLLELGETGAEFCQIGNQSCSVPFELYDLPDLQGILSLEVWNDCLTEEERFSLTQYLPDMDHFSFMHTLKDLFTGCNFHFGSPIAKLFDMLKGGLCEPRVALYQQALNYFQRRQHYHLLRMHHNNMVGNLCQIRDAWQNCKGYSIDEKLQVLNIARSQKSLMYEKMEDYGMGSGSSEREESGEHLWSKRAKDKRFSRKPGRHSPTLDFSLQGKSMALEPEYYGMKNPKGLLKVSGSKTSTMKELSGRVASAYHGLEMKSGPYSSPSSQPRKNTMSGYESGAALQLRGRSKNYDDPVGTMYEVPIRKVSRGTAGDRFGVLKLGKKHGSLRSDDFPSDGSTGVTLALKDAVAATGKNRNANSMAEIKALAPKLAKTSASYDYAKKSKYPEDFQQSVVKDQMMPAISRTQLASLRGNNIDMSDGSEPLWQEKFRGEAFSTGRLKYDNWNVKSKKWKTGRELSDLTYKSVRASSPQSNGRLFHDEYGNSLSAEKTTASYRQNGRTERGRPKNIRMVAEDEETESGSSGRDDEVDDDTPLVRSKFGHSSSLLEERRRPVVSPGVDTIKIKSDQNNKKAKARALRNTHCLRKSEFDEHLHMPEAGNHHLKAKQKAKMRGASQMQNFTCKTMGDEHYSSLVTLPDDGIERKRGYKLGKKNIQVRGRAGENLLMSSAERRLSEEARPDFSVQQADHFQEDALVERHGLGDDVSSDVPLLGCNLSTKKRKLKDDVVYRDRGDEYDDMKHNTHQEIHEISEPPATELGAPDKMEIKTQKKPFTLITPTIHTGFSFSIIHLLSAVRMAMITPHLEDSLDVGNHVEKSDGMQQFRDDLNAKHNFINGIQGRSGLDINKSEHSGQLNVPSLSVMEIVNRVRSNPGDPCILETQEPLQDLVRGVLKIFSSKTAPLGAKGWKMLVSYDKSTKSWSWTGPVSQSASDHETVEEVTSSEAWHLPHKMLVKLVDAFANWLKSGQETLQQIGSLPAPPAALMEFNLDEKDRFRDLRAQKSLTTISPSSEEVKAYFRKEEFLRYSVPDRAFAYTAADGRKSIVAPLRRCGGKPTSKARDHFMLKRDRPPHVTILCLVRDAAARLPGNIGTRADVCTLIRDSQYIVEDVSDAQVNQIVSGALDRLHYERDPCVQFDGERKLWVYLHREREEEDFEDDGTSSTKKWKRQKKDAVEQFDQGAAGVAFHGSGERLIGGSAAGFDLCSDLNVEPPCIDDDNRMEFMYNEARQSVEDDTVATHVVDRATGPIGNPMVWEALGLNPLQESKLLCQENSTNEDFDEGTEKPAAFLSAGLL